VETILTSMTRVVLAPEGISDQNENASSGDQEVENEEKGTKANNEHDKAEKNSVNDKSEL